MATYPLHLPAVRVVQPLGEFFAVAIPAEALLDVGFLDPTRIDVVDRKRFIYRLIGSQREASTTRAKKIAEYVDTVEAAFPNSIILGANYINYGEYQTDGASRWRIEKRGANWQLIIPTNAKMATVIDGQHRLLSYRYCKPERRNMELLCSVYMDLPHAYQAYLFATININQRKVDKSLAYEQFGYNLDDEDRTAWAPDKCAVFLTRKLNLDAHSPLAERIKIAVLDDEFLLSEPSQEGWQVSIACIVEGILPLISCNPARDRDTLHKSPAGARKRAALPDDLSPLRALYLRADDIALYGVLKGYFEMCREYLWARASSASYITKTIGIQAQFDVLKRLASKADVHDLPKSARVVLEKAARIDFANSFYQASGKGRVRVRNTILLAGSLLRPEELPEQEKMDYLRILGVG